MRKVAATTSSLEIPISSAFIRRVNLKEAPQIMCSTSYNIAKYIRYWGGHQQFAHL